MQISTSTGVVQAIGLSSVLRCRSDVRLRYQTDIPKEMHYKGTTPAHQLFDDYETGRACPSILEILRRPGRLELALGAHRR